jgi:hypothetical protein
MLSSFSPKGERYTLPRMGALNQEDFMKYFSAPAALIPTLMASALICRCVTTGGTKSTQAEPASATEKSAPATHAQAKTPPGMNEKGEVVDSSQVEAGHGKQVKGLGGWEGEITGKPAPKSKFAKLQIGMSMKQATDLVGQPTDSGAYITGKAWIPFYFGSDRTRFEMIYKNQGRLVFAGGSLGDYTGGHLVWIINNSREGGYRN